MAAEFVGKEDTRTDRLMGLEDETADVLVVGGGGAGLSAAIEARRSGASVILLEKGSELRGSTGRSVGSITASGTPDQARIGIRDSAAEHIEDYFTLAGEHAHRDDPDLVRLLCENVGETIAWLRSLGVEFFGPVQEPPHRKPRMHNVLPNSRSYIFHLSRCARKLGVDIRLNSQAIRLVLSDGRVGGVEVLDSLGKARCYWARRGVVLAGGDYSASREYKALHSEAYAAVPAINPLNTGDCLKMATEIGARASNLDFVPPPNFRFVSSPREHVFNRLSAHGIISRPMRWSLLYLPGWLIRPFVTRFVLAMMVRPDMSLFRNGAMLVNSEGNRFYEFDARNAPGFEIAQQPGNLAYVIFDSRIAELYRKWPHYICTAPGVSFAYLDDFRRSRPDLYGKSNSLDGLAARLGMPSENLAKAVSGHNEDAPSADRLVKPPFYALGPVKSWIITTEGGLKVSTSLEVLREDGSVIPGLFAAGMAGQGGLTLRGHGHKLGWAFTSGRFAGRNAARLLA